MGRFSFNHPNWWLLLQPLPPSRGPRWNCTDGKYLNVEMTSGEMLKNRNRADWPSNIGLISLPVF